MTADCQPGQAGWAWDFTLTWKTTFLHYFNAGQESSLCERFSRHPEIHFMAAEQDGDEGQCAKCLAARFVRPEPIPQQELGL